MVAGFYGTQEPGVSVSRNVVCAVLFRAIGVFQLSRYQVSVFFNLSEQLANIRISKIWEVLFTYNIITICT